MLHDAAHDAAHTAEGHPQLCVAPHAHTGTSERAPAEALIGRRHSIIPFTPLGACHSSVNCCTQAHTHTHTHTFTRARPHRLPHQGRRAQALLPRQRQLLHVVICCCRRLGHRGRVCTQGLIVACKLQLALGGGGCGAGIRGGWIEASNLEDVGGGSGEDGCRWRRGDAEGCMACIAVHALYGSVLQAARHERKPLKAGRER
eukprot:1161662-Pelagomonas_calceolata.AAC.8